jgi:NAD(P)-dependent dehydrogenase (short-subunit alcohol dehydrogenase family)
MQLEAGKVAVVTGGASGIGLALADRFAGAGMRVVLADVDEPGLEAAAAQIGAHGVDTLTVRTDVSDEGAVQRLAEKTVERFGGAHLVCNNAGIAAKGDPWFGPLSSWTWTIGVNLWGVIHGVRAFLPVLTESGGGHIVNTASMAGLMPGAAAPYDATKHAVVALSEDLYLNLRVAGLPIGVSVLCPGWVRTRIATSERNFPAELGEPAAPVAGAEMMYEVLERVIDEGMPPAVVADLVAAAVEEQRFWVLPHPDFVDIAVRRWHSIAEGQNPVIPTDIPGLTRPQ